MLVHPQLAEGFEEVSKSHSMEPPTRGSARNIRGPSDMAGKTIMNYFDKIDEKISGSQPSRANFPEDDIRSELDSPRSHLTALDMARKVHLLSVGEGSPSTASISGGSLNRDLVLAKLNKEKVLSLIKAWEENMKKKSDNRHKKKVAKISAWELAKKARAEATLKASEERIENEKAAYVEKTKNKVALVQRVAQEQRALAEAHHGQEVLRAEEIAAKCRASGMRPRKFVSCF